MPLVPLRLVNSAIVLGRGVGVHLHKSLLVVALDWVPLLWYPERLLRWSKAGGVDDLDWQGDVLSLAMLHPVVVFDEHSERVLHCKDLAEPRAAKIDTWLFILIVVSVNQPRVGALSEPELSSIDIRGAVDHRLRFFALVLNVHWDVKEKVLFEQLSCFAATFLDLADLFLSLVEISRYAVLMPSCPIELEFKVSDCALASPVVTDDLDDYLVTRVILILH